MPSPVPDRLEPTEDEKAPGRVAGLMDYSRKRADDARVWAEEARGRSPMVDHGFGIAERDRNHLGGLLAGAVAYRFFLWLLPFSLLIVGLLGVLTGLDGGAVENVGDDVGLQGALTAVLTEGARQRGWWIALAIGLFGTAYAGLGVVRALRVSHAAAWGIRPKRAPGLLNGSLVVAGIGFGLLITAGALGWLRERSALWGLIGSLLTMAVYFTAWLRVSVHLPRRTSSVRALVPGAVLVAIGAEGLHLFTAYYLAGQVERVSSVYGTIGMALTLLLWLFIIARLMVSSAIVNAELWQRRTGGADAPADGPVEGDGVSADG